MVKLKTLSATALATLCLCSNAFAGDNTTVFNNPTTVDLQTNGPAIVTISPVNVNTVLNLDINVNLDKLGSSSADTSSRGKVIAKTVRAGLSINK